MGPGRLPRRRASARRGLVLELHLLKQSLLLKRTPGQNSARDSRGPGRSHSQATEEPLWGRGFCPAAGLPPGVASFWSYTYGNQSLLLKRTPGQNSARDSRTPKRSHSQATEAPLWGRGFCPAAGLPPGVASFWSYTFGNQSLLLKRTPGQNSARDSRAPGSFTHRQLRNPCGAGASAPPPGFRPAWPRFGATPMETIPVIEKNTCLAEPHPILRARRTRGRLAGGARATAC